MIVTHKIDMDFVSKNENAAVPQIRAVQGDCNTRMVELTLYANQTAWNVPEGAMVQMRYRKPDGTGGVYDTMPDGTLAWRVSENTVSVLLAPQMLTASGVVRSQIALVLSEKFLATFEVQIVVEEDPSAGVLESEDYTNMKTWLTEEIHLALNAAKLSGEFDGATFVPAVSSNGELSWTNNKGMENPTPVNINAPQGILPVANGGTGANNAAVARANLGAAPAGFGLGGGGTSFSADNIDNMKSNGWFYSSKSDGYYIGSVPVFYLLLRVDSWKDTAGCSVVTQTLFYYDIEIKRIHNGNAWGAWEWVNPSMAPGVEYRTTERYNGKAVYAQLVDFGALPDATTKTIYITANGITDVVSYEAIYKNSGKTSGAMLFSSSDVTSNYGISNNQIGLHITAPANSSTYNLMVIIKYVK